VGACCYGGTRHGFLATPVPIPSPAPNRPWFLGPVGMEQVQEELTALQSQCPDGRVSYGPAFFVVAYTDAPLLVGYQELKEVNQNSKRMRRYLLRLLKNPVLSDRHFPLRAKRVH